MSITFQNIEKEQVFAVITQCTADPRGFYMKMNGRSVRVDYINDATDSNTELVLDSGITLKIAEIASNSNILNAPFPANSVPISQGLEVFSAGYSIWDGKIITHSGKISSLQKDSEGREVFTINNPQISNYPGSPVFSYDEIQKIANLIGVILPQVTDHSSQAIYIDTLRENEKKIQEFFTKEESLGEARGGAPIQVQNGNIKGMEVGRGEGPRSIKINGAGKNEVTYKLTFNEGTKTLNPHHDANYNKKGNQPTLYKNAVDEFVESLIHPPSFKFDFLGTQYTATKKD